MARVPSITIDGREYELRPPGERELKLMDEYVMKHRRSTIELAKDNLEGLSKDQQAMMLREALRLEALTPKGEVTGLEYAAVMDTREGAAYLMWLCLSRDGAELKLEDVTRAIVKKTDEEFANILRQRDLLVEDEEAEGDDHGEPEPGGGGADPADG